MTATKRMDQGGTLKDIRNAAFHLFGRYGYDGVSIMAVAKQVGITKAAMYWHYDGKVELYLDCLAELHNIYIQHLEKSLLENPTPGTAIMAIFRGVCELLEDSRIQSGVAGYWLPPSNDALVPASEAQRQFNRSARKVVEKALKDGIDAGLLTERVRLAEMSAAIYSIVESFTLTLGQGRPAAEQHRQLGVLFHTFFLAYESGDQMASQALKLMRDEIAPQQLLEI